MNHNLTNNNSNNGVDGLNEQAEEILQAETKNTSISQNINLIIIKTPTTTEVTKWFNDFENNSHTDQIQVYQHVLHN